MTISFALHQFPPAIIRHAVWLHRRFTVRNRDLEDLLAERRLDVSLRSSAAVGIEVRANRFANTYLRAYNATLESDCAEGPPRDYNSHPVDRCRHSDRELR
jgi:hypothetical protein